MKETFSSVFVVHVLATLVESTYVGISLLDDVFEGPNDSLALGESFSCMQLNALRDIYV
jgi:hypothetical protein